jgi:hypothetical protein
LAQTNHQKTKYFKSSAFSRQSLTGKIRPT